MKLTHETIRGVPPDPYELVESHDCPMSTCAAPAGSPCRTGKRKVTIQYLTARFRGVPSLAQALKVPIPAVRKPGTPLDRTAAPSGRRRRADRTRPPRLRPCLQRPARLPTRLPGRAGVTRIFSQKISTRATKRPELEKAVSLARELRASSVRVTLVVHEHKRLGRGIDLAALAEERRGIDLAALAEELKAHDVGLEFLTGELQGSHDPSGVVFAVPSARSGMEREYIHDRTLEGHESARKRGKTIGGVGITDGDLLSMALHLRDQELSLRDIASRLVITMGAKKGQLPSPATVMRMLREHDEQTATV
jgi:DNA invertase Pin-like site-specific DNA recombinase